MQIAPPIRETVLDLPRQESRTQHRQDLAQNRGVKWAAASVRLPSLGWDRVEAAAWFILGSAVSTTVIYCLFIR
jgi:hypothetical protein